MMLDNIVLAEALGLFIALIISPIVYRLFRRKSLAERHREHLDSKFLDQSKQQFRELAE